MLFIRHNYSILTVETIRRLFALLNDNDWVPDRFFMNFETWSESSKSIPLDFLDSCEFPGKNGIGEGSEKYQMYSIPTTLFPLQTGNAILMLQEHGSTLVKGVTPVPFIVITNTGDVPVLAD